MTDNLVKIKTSFNEVNIDDKLLLLVCCAPCSCLLLKELIMCEIKVTVLFYNPNIMPFAEYQIRKDMVKIYCKKYKIKYVDLDNELNYENENRKWFHNVAKGLEMLPEMSLRCQKCFSFRIDKLFNYAKENNFKLVSTTLAVSIYKNFNQVEISAKLLEKKYSTVKYWYYNWQKNDNYKFRKQLIREEKLYDQNYCGCTFSIRKKQIVNSNMSNKI